MTRRAVVLVGALVAAVLCGAADGIAKTPPKDEAVIVRYLGRSKGRVWRIRISRVGSTSKKTVVVPNGADKKPLPAIKKVVDELDVGDFIKLTIEKKRGVTVVKKIEPYKIKPGEDDPTGYIFVEAEEEVVRNKRVWLVTLKKLEKEITVRVATKKNAKGKEETDPNLVAKIAECRIDKVVDVELSGSKRAPVLVYIGKYVAPVEAVFTKLIDKTKDDPNKTAIKATVNGTTKTFFLQTTIVRGKPRVKGKLLAVAKKLKPGDLVEIKQRPRGKQQLAVRLAKLKKSKDDP